MYELTKLRVVESDTILFNRKALNFLLQSFHGTK